MRPGTLLRLRALRYIVKHEIPPNAAVLDVGAFDGVMSDHLCRARENLNLTVVDLDQDGLEQARAKGLNTVHASVNELPQPSNSIDRVLCLDLIEHLEDDAGAFQEMARVLKPGGRIVLTTPDEHGVHFPFISKQRNTEVNIGWGHLRLGYSRSSLRRLFEQCGLRILYMTGYFNVLTRMAYSLAYLAPHRPPGKTMIYNMAAWLEPFLHLGNQEHIVVAEKPRPGE